MCSVSFVELFQCYFERVGVCERLFGSKCCGVSVFESKAAGGDIQHSFDSSVHWNRCCCAADVEERLLNIKYIV